MSGTERGRRRSKREPGPICPRCGRTYSHLETRRVGGREYLYAVHESRAGGQRTREFCYLGPKDGYAAGLVAHSWRGTPWLALSAMGATREEEFRLEYLGEVARAALDAAATEEDQRDPEGPGGCAARDRGAPGGGPRRPAEFSINSGG